MSEDPIPPPDDGPVEYPGVDRQSCQLLGPTALVVQALMGVFVILSLVYKRQRESPKRPWRIWLFDVSKQVVGQMFVHGVNVLVSSLLSHHTASNACVTYFLNILVDTTLGVALLYLILQFLAFLSIEKMHLKGFESGVYGTPPSIIFWFRQSALYVVALTTMKFLVIALLALFPGLDEIGAWLLSWTRTSEGDSIQVIFVMGIFPIVMNVLQFWLIDSIVKASAEAVALNSDFPDAFDSADREPLFGVPSDDEDDDDAHTRPHDVENPRSPPHTHIHSRSHSYDKRPSGQEPYESKSMGSTTPAGDTLELHEYPPSLSNSVASASTSHSLPSIKETSGLGKKRRSPPEPITIVKSASHPVLNTSTVESPPSRPPQEDDWDTAWEGADDWANRVGEEDWTGRRIEDKKDVLHNIWESNPSVPVAS